MNPTYTIPLRDGSSFSVDLRLVAYFAYTEEMGDINRLSMRIVGEEETRSVFPVPSKFDVEDFRRRWRAAISAGATPEASQPEAPHPSATYTPFDPIQRAVEIGSSQADLALGFVGGQLTERVGNSLRDLIIQTAVMAAEGARRECKRRDWERLSERELGQLLDETPSRMSDTGH